MQRAVTDARAAPIPPPHNGVRSMPYMEHMFPTLKSFASKEYKFQQPKSIELVLARYPDDAASGVCFGAVMMWVKEKFTTTGSLWHGSQAKAFSSNGDAEVHQRNKYTMRAAGEFHQYYTPLTPESENPLAR
jgi:hypothetical protein